MNKTDIEALQNRLDGLQKELNSLQETLDDIRNIVANIYYEAEEERTQRYVVKDDQLKGNIEGSVSRAEQNTSTYEADSAMPSAEDNMNYIAENSSQAEQNSEEYLDPIEEQFNRFVEKYNSGSTNFDLLLDIKGAYAEKLNMYLRWSQVPEELLQELALNKTNELMGYYADYLQVEGGTYYLVAPMEPDGNFTEQDLIRFAIPYFFEVGYSSSSCGWTVKVIRPAIFERNEWGDLTLIEKGVLSVAR